MEFSASNVQNLLIGGSKISENLHFKKLKVSGRILIRATP